MIIKKLREFEAYLARPDHVFPTGTILDLDEDCDFISNPDRLMIFWHSIRLLCDSGRCPENFIVRPFPLSNTDLRRLPEMIEAHVWPQGFGFNFQNAYGMGDVAETLLNICRSPRCPQNFYLNLKGTNDLGNPHLGSDSMGRTAISDESLARLLRSGQLKPGLKLFTPAMYDLPIHTSATIMAGEYPQNFKLHYIFYYRSYLDDNVEELKRLFKQAAQAVQTNSRGLRLRVTCTHDTMQRFNLELAGMLGEFDAPQPSLSLSPSAEALRIPLRADYFTPLSQEIEILRRSQIKSFLQERQEMCETMQFGREQIWADRAANNTCPVCYAEYVPPLPEGSGAAAEMEIVPRRIRKILRCGHCICAICLRTMTLMARERRESLNCHFCRKGIAGYHSSIFSSNYYSTELF